MRRISLVMMAVAIGFGAVSCSNSVTKADFKAELDKAGLPAAVNTQCLVDKLEAKGFTFKKYGELGADDQTKIAEATKECFSMGALTPTSIAVPKN